jgi:polyhydroxyalkanoate synthesis regulator phasin
MLDVINVVKTSGMGFDQLQEKLKGVDMRALKALFTFTQMTEDIRELTEEVSRSGSAWETYKKYLETTEGRMAALRAENDRMMRSIGEGASAILSMVAPAFLKAGDAIISAWRSIIGTITGTNLERYLGYVEFRVRVLGNASEEAAAEWIKSWVDMGQITLSEGLKIAESVGIYNETIQELIDRAVEAGVAIPESFQAMASNATTSSQQTVNALKSIEEQMESLENQVKILSSTFDLLGKGVGLAEGFYDVTVKVMRALGYDVELSDEARESKERLAATQQVLNYIMNAYGLVQEALKLKAMGATEASDMLLNSFNLLISATEDGVVTNQEFIDILRQLGVDAGNVAGSLHSVLKTALEATKSAIESNIDAVNSFIASLKNLDGMTIHTYHIHHILTEEGGVIAPPVPENIKEITETLKEWAWQPEAVPPLQRGLWYVPRDDYIARLHRGEMVLPRNVAEWFRSHGPVAAQKTVNVRVNINAGGITDPNLLAEIVSRKLVQRLRAM